MIRKKELIFTLKDVKINTVRYESVTMSNPRDPREPGNARITAQFYIPHWILDNQKPKAIKITFEEVADDSK